MLKIYVWEYKGKEVHAFADGLLEARLIALEGFCSYRDECEVTSDVEIIKHPYYDWDKQPFVEFVMETEPEVKGIYGEYIVVYDCSDY